MEEKCPGSVEQGRLGNADQIFQYTDPTGRRWENIADYLAYLAETTSVLDPLKPRIKPKKRKKRKI